MPFGQTGRAGGLDSEERAVLRQESSVNGAIILLMFAAALAALASLVAFHPPHRGVVTLFYLGAAYFGFYQAGFSLIFFPILYYKQNSSYKKVLGFDPGKQNREEGIVFWFYELRITRTELIRGYASDASRIPLRGLKARVKNTGSVTDQRHEDDRSVRITIKGPETNFDYSVAATGFLSSFMAQDARQFAALLNHEARVLPAPRKAVAGEKCTKVRCYHCHHVQTEPVGQGAFSCEQCGAHLNRRTSPAEGI